MATDQSTENSNKIEECESFLKPTDENKSEPAQSENMGCFDRFFASSIKDLKSACFYRALLGEMIGVMFLVFVGCTSPWGDLGVDHVRVSLAFGISVATMVWVLANVSGGHINPAVSAGMLVTRKISLIKFILYVIFQCIGAILGSYAQKGLTCQYQIKELQYTKCLFGTSSLGAGVTPGVGFTVEFLITFVLVITVFATCDKSRSDLAGSGPLAIGLSVTMCHLAFIRVTGSSMNTARTFGPAVVAGYWENHWIYWVGPILGGIVAGLLYEFVFAGNAGVSKFKSWLKDSNYENEDDTMQREALELKRQANA